MAQWPTGIIFAYYGLESQVPDGWRICDGQILPRQGHEDLYLHFEITNPKLILDNERFRMPDLRGDVLTGMNENDEYFDTVGQEGGEAEVTLTTEQLPRHQHPMKNLGTSGTGNLNNAVTIGSSKGTLLGNGTGFTGGGQPHNNLQPYAVVNWVMYTRT